MDGDLPEYRGDHGAGRRGGPGASAHLAGSQDERDFHRQGDRPRRRGRPALRVRPDRAILAGDGVTAEAVFDVSYVAWGLRNPSVLFLHVSPMLAVTVRTEASLRVEGVGR